MPLVISGKLSLPVTGQPASNAEVRFRAVNSVGEVIQGAESIARCDAQGNYSISIEFARYELSTKISTVDFVVHGLVTINSETSASDLEDLIFLIGMSDDSGLTDELLKEFLAIKSATEKAAAEAKVSAQTASDAETAITPMYNYFNANYPTFEINYQDFSVKYPDVVTKHGEVVTLAAQASDSASQAHDSAEQAKYNANQTFISGGLFKPTSAQEYPDVSGIVRDTIWIVEFDSQTDFFKFTFGDLSGKTTTNADMMFYDTPSNSWSLIPTSVSGGVVSVDGDAGPAVNLESKYFWANNKPSIGDVDNLQVELNSKYSPVNKPTADDVGAVPSAVRSDWASKGVIDNVIGLMAWNNFGNNHVIFDASKSLDPNGGATSNKDSKIAWGDGLPSLMGFNGSDTFGVRVDSARVSDVATGSYTKAESDARYYSAENKPPAMPFAYGRGGTDSSLVSVQKFYFASVIEEGVTYDSANRNFVVSEAGFYEVIHSALGVNSEKEKRVMLSRNRDVAPSTSDASTYFAQSYCGLGLQYSPVTTSGIVECSSGDTIQAWAAGGEFYLGEASNSDYFNHISIKRIR